MAIEIDANDVTTAEDFLETLLTEEIPSGRFTQGSALRDLVVKAMAFTFAHLQKENKTVKSLQSLLTVRDIATTDPDVDQAVAASTDAILSNWFITRKVGTFAKGVIFIEVTRKQDYVIPGAQRFVYDRDHVFYLDIPDPTVSIVVPASDLIPVTTTDGTITAYQFSKAVTAAKTGADYNVAPSVWQSGTGFSAFASRVFNVSKFGGGKGRETVSESIARSQNAVTVRNLINTKSIDAVLRDKYSTINRMLVTGMGDPEMRRDLRLDTGTMTGLHVGGHYDVYLELPRVEASYEGTLGARFVRPDGLINVFRDAAVADWTALIPAIQLGDAIRVNSGLEEAPKDFVIKAIKDTELHVSTNTPFSVATDEDGAVFTYYIYRPLYTADLQIYPTVGLSTTGESSRQVQIENTLVMPGGALFDVIDVAVTNPDPGDPFIDPADGFIHFPVRSNEAPAAVLELADLEYQIYNEDPGTAQSQISMDYLRLHSDFSGKNVRIKYETLSTLDAIHAFTRDRFERVLSANILVKGYHQVYLGMSIPYRLRPNAPGLVDETALRQALVDYINSFDPNDVIDVSDISYVVRAYSGNIGAVLPFSIFYTLISPDGRTIQYTTADQVRLIAENLSDERANSSLTNPAQLTVSDNTVRYVTTLDRIYVEKRT